MEWGRALGGAWVGRSAAGLLAGASRAGVRVGVVLRYFTFAMLLVASLMFYVWSRVDVRASAAELDRVNTQLATRQAEQERLRLELATRQDLARLGQVGAAMGLVSDVQVRTVTIGVAQ